MNKKTLTVVIVTAVATLVLAPKLRSLPVVGQIPTL